MCCPPAAGYGRSLTFGTAMAITGSAMGIQGAYVAATLLLQPFCYLTLNVLESFIGILEVIRLGLVLAAYNHLQANPLPRPVAPAAAAAASRALLSTSEPGMWEQITNRLTKGSSMDLAAVWLTVIQIALCVAICLYIAGRRLAGTAKVAAVMSKMKRYPEAEMKPDAFIKGEDQPQRRPSLWARTVSGAFAHRSGSTKHGLLVTRQHDPAREDVTVSLQDWERDSLSPTCSEADLEKADDAMSDVDSPPSKRVE